MADRSPAVTPGDATGGATVLAFLGVATLSDASDVVRVTALICAALVALATVAGHARLRVARNYREAAKG